MDWRDQRDADVTAPRKLDLSGHRLIPRLTLVTLGPGAQKGRSRRPRMPLPRVTKFMGTKGT